MQRCIAMLEIRCYRLVFRICTRIVASLNKGAIDEHTFGSLMDRLSPEIRRISMAASSPAIAASCNGVVYAESD